MMMMIMMMMIIIIINNIISPRINWTSQSGIMKNEQKCYKEKRQEDSKI
jgi:hypothetical protein